MIEAVIDPRTWYIVVNPASGAGRAARLRPRLVAALERARVAHRCVESAGPGDTERLVAGAVRAGSRRLLAVGGDGTFHELINGLFASGIPPRECLVAAAAGGTGNDWSRAMEVPDDPRSLAASLARAASRPADVGMAVDAAGRRAVFHNVAGAGIDAEVIRLAPRRGPRAVAYLFGLARALVRFRAPRFVLVADGREMAGDFLLVLAAIGPRCGGGMRLTPAALPDDGWLDLLALEPMGPLPAVARLPKLFDGRLADDPSFRTVRCRKLTIAAAPRCGVELDGQPFGTTPVELAVLPGALAVLDCRAAT
jgi:YegS/Rv2252/BmrU family lipid kinase